MDFSTLNRRQLQALCKRNAIPANITNVAMADSLRALDHVEGLEDLLNQSPEKTATGSVSALRTAGKTATRRIPIKEPESSQPLNTGRRGRKPVPEKVDQEMAEVPNTPVAPSTRRRAPLASALQKTETQKENALVQSVYNTRRSVRLLEKNLSKLTLDNENSMPFKMDELSTEIHNGSEKSDGSVVEGSDMQTVSEVSSERVDEEKPTEENLQALTVNLSCEQQSFVGSKSSDMSEAQGDYNQKFDFESDSATEEEPSEDEATNEEPMDCSKVSDIHGEEGEFDQSDSNTEVDDGSSTEDESIREDSDGSSTDEKEEEASEEDEVLKSAKSMSPHHPLPAHEETPHSEIQVAEMQESTNSEAAPSLASQFPRPNLSKPEESAGKKQSEISSYIFDDEESIDSDDKKDVEMEKAGDAKSKEELSQMSLRQLKKKLKILNNKAKMEDKPRTPLQEVPENQVAVNKAVNAN